MSVSPRMTRLLWTAVAVLVVIGVAAVTIRTLTLLFPAQFTRSSSPTAGLNAGFARHAALTFVHILPGALFLLLAPFQFMPNVRRRHRDFHRWSGRVLVVTGLVIGASALIMSFKMNIGGPNETAATTLFAIAFLICLLKAYLFIRQRNIVRHREWMIRAYGIGLGVAATRPVVGIFFAFRRLTPHEFFGIAFWLGFTTTFMATEAWIDYTRARGIDKEDVEKLGVENSVAA